jgi:hypothetical protein
MELCCNNITLSYLHIISVAALSSLCKVLGSGIGLGLAKKRPTKASQSNYCTIGVYLTSVEIKVEVPVELLFDPEAHCRADGIDLIYYDQHRTLLDLQRLW